MSEPIDYDLVEKIYRDALAVPDENPIVDWTLDDAVSLVRWGLRYGVIEL